MSEILNNRKPQELISDPLPQAGTCVTMPAWTKGRTIASW